MLRGARCFAVLFVALVALGVVHAQPPPLTNIPALIAAQGFPCETHTTTTEDGFELVIFRVPFGRDGPQDRAAGPAPVVFLQHGVVDSAATWFVNLANESLGFILADAGYDVWAGNVRGNGQSWVAAGCSYEDACFWASSWDQYASLDLPAMLGYVLNTTGVGSLAYVGHSQGTEIAFAHFSAASPLASRVSVFAALAPIALLGHMTVPFITALADVPAGVIYTLAGDKEFSLAPGALAHLLPGVCTVTPGICEDAVCEVAGCAQSNLNTSRFDVLFEYYPSPTSVQNMVHYSQGVRSDEFIHYDYGSAAANMAAYGTETPPLYDLSAFSLKVGLFSGSLDKLADPTDVAVLASVLPQGSIVFERQYPIGHGGFVWGLEAASTVYADLLQLLDQFPPQV